MFVPKTITVRGVPTLAGPILPAVQHHAIAAGYTKDEAGHIYRRGVPVGVGALRRTVKGIAVRELRKLIYSARNSRREAGAIRDAIREIEAEGPDAMAYLRVMAHGVTPALPLIDPADIVRPEE